MPSRKELIIPVFIPHKGCPHLCVFCNQQRISGTAESPSAEEVRDMLLARLGPDTPHAVIAFYGGSFTGLPEGEQLSYLLAAQEFLEKKYASHVRLSTRPDQLDSRSLSFLKLYGVKVIELGVQSMDDRVLALSGRGHTSADTVRAARLVKSAGFVLGIQVMAGLPGDTPARFMDTISKIISLGPSFVRIYPVLVVSGSRLAETFKNGEYKPLTLDEAVDISAKAVKLFRSAAIKVVRVGLQPGRELEESLVAGPYHPAFGHLVESALAFERMRAALPATPDAIVPGLAEFRVNPAELSVYKGIRAENEKALNNIAGGLAIKIKADSSVPAGGLELVMA
ncbi:MAG: radical SAM protein [Nitrospirota bacterium]